MIQKTSVETKPNDQQPRSISDGRQRTSSSVMARGPVSMDVFAAALGERLKPSSPGKLRQQVVRDTQTPPRGQQGTAAAADDARNKVEQDAFRLPPYSVNQTMEEKEEKRKIFPRHYEPVGFLDGGVADVHDRLMTIMPLRAQSAPILRARNPKSNKTLRTYKRTMPQRAYSVPHLKQKSRGATTRNRGHSESHTGHLPYVQKFSRRPAVRRQVLHHIPAAPPVPAEVSYQHVHRHEAGCPVLPGMVAPV